MTCLESMCYGVAGKEFDGFLWFMSRSEKNQYFKLVTTTTKISINRDTIIKMMSKMCG